MRPVLVLVTALGLGLTVGTVPASPAGDAGAYRPPADGDVSRLFDPPAVRWGAGHRGVDLAAAVGDPVVAPGPGVVTVAGTVVDRGVVTISHSDGLRSSLEPLTPTVAVGDTVAAGDVVGTVAPAAGTHAGLHWGVRRGDDYLDPLGLLGPAAPVVLLPLP